LRFGIGFIASVPPHEDGTRAVANRLSTIDRTHLGDLFRLREKAGAIHIGEMSVDIPLHTDMVYKQRVPELQMLHALEAADTGGENVFVDSMALLPDMSEPDIALLRDNPVWFVAQSDTVSFRGLHPVLAFDARRRFRGVHFNEYKLVLPVHRWTCRQRCCASVASSSIRAQASATLRRPMHSLSCGRFAAWPEIAVGS
jgi:alpha-ketoglutarate-dependent taurine dioxygenase